MVKVEPFDVGDTVTVEVEFTDEEDRLANPTTATVIVKKPDGTETTYTDPDLTHPSAGVYSRAVTFDQPGVWVVRAEGTGTIPLVRERRIKVRASDV